MHRVLPVFGFVLAAMQAPVCLAQALTPSQLAGTWKYENGPGSYVVSVSGNTAKYDWTRSQTYGRDTLTCTTYGSGPIRGVGFTAQEFGGCKVPSLNTDGIKARGTCTFSLVAKDRMTKQCGNEEGGRANHTLVRMP
jgi:hypothetical protein